MLSANVALMAVIFSQDYQYLLGRAGEFNSQITGRSEDYLKDMDGFMLFDDPFTELDPGRRKLAAELLARLANDKQVIFMTCHPEHSTLFDVAD